MSERFQPDFESIPHWLENNKFSQAHLDENRHKYRGQAALVYSLLIKAIRLDGDMADAHGIKHLARRIGDIGDSKRIKLIDGFEYPQEIKSSAFNLTYSTSEYGIYIDREWGLLDGKRTDLMVYFLPGYRKQFIEKGWVLNKKRWWFSKLYTHPEIIKQIESYKK